MENFDFVCEFPSLKEFARAYNYTYDSVRTNWTTLCERHLKNYDRKLVKEKRGNKCVVKVYERKSEKNSDLEGEEWRNSTREGFLVSNKGRIKRVSDGFITLGSLTSKGYYNYGKRESGNYMVVHREVMQAFCPIENSDIFYVDHIDGNRSNNVLENLRWVSPQQNAIYRDENQQKLHNKLNELIVQYGYNHVEEVLENFAALKW